MDTSQSEGVLIYDLRSESDEANKPFRDEPMKNFAEEAWVLANGTVCLCDVGGSQSASVLFCDEMSQWEEGGEGAGGGEDTRDA